MDYSFQHTNTHTYIFEAHSATQSLACVCDKTASLNTANDLYYKIEQIKLHSKSKIISINGKNRDFFSF